MKDIIIYSIKLALFNLVSKIILKKFSSCNNNGIGILEFIIMVKLTYSSRIVIPILGKIRIFLAFLIFIIMNLIFCLRWAVILTYFLSLLRIKLTLSHPKSFETRKRVLLMVFFYSLITIKLFTIIEFLIAFIIASILSYQL